jgi:hypothetical protein
MPKRSVPEPEEPTPEAAVEEPAPEGDEAPAFANRAERRAHGRGKTPPPDARKGHFPSNRGSVQQPRQWGNRRSG